MIKEIMSENIISGNSDMSIKEVAKLMKQNNIGFIPIKDNDDYVGVITDRDICLAIPTLKSTEDSIKSYITNNVISIDIESSINEALKVMSDNKVKRVLVKKDDKMTGVLSLSDILNYTNDKEIVNTYRCIFYIHDNDKYKNAEIDEFYL